MEMSILKNTKKMLGIPEDDESYDTDVILHINSAFSILNGLGIGPLDGFTIEGDEAEWADFIDVADETTFNLVKICIYLRVRLNFDPPATSFAITALEKQLLEHEWRLNERREQTEWTDPDPSPEDDASPIPLVIDGGVE